MASLVHNLGMLDFDDGISLLQGAQKNLARPLQDRTAYNFLWREDAELNLLHFTDGG
jgi:hypothetical protein